jgi:hypothetical protein
MTASFELPPGTSMSIYIRSLEHGFAVVLGLASGAIYGLWSPLQHLAKQAAF